MAINSESFVKINLSLQQLHAPSDNLQFKLSTLGPNKKTLPFTFGDGSNKKDAISALSELTFIPGTQSESQELIRKIKIKYCSNFTS
jgi:hypothetical protein